MGEEEQEERRSPGEIALRRRRTSDESSHTIEMLLKEIHRVNCAMFTLMAEAYEDKVDSSKIEKLRSVITQSIKKTE